MRLKGERFCRSCKHHSVVHEVDSYMLFCDNPLTKELPYPTGFLSRDSRECQYFEPEEPPPPARPQSPHQGLIGRHD
jgi:hypothetical protein